MKRQTIARLKKLNAENLAALGADRLAALLISVAETRPDLKRRLKMEVAAEQGAEHLAPLIDKRLATLQTSRGQISWRQKPAVVRDLDALRELICERLAGIDPQAALERLWLFLDTALPVGRRLREHDGAVAAVYARAARDLGGFLSAHDPQAAADALVEAIVNRPQAWAEWLPQTLGGLPQQTAQAALAVVSARGERAPGWATIVRCLADAAGDIEAFRGTYPAEALATPSVATEIARRYLASGDLRRAGEILRPAAPRPGHLGRLAAPDFEWESAWIDYLERSGEIASAQEVRWASFERTLDVERARAFIRRLEGFDQVEAESRLFAHAAAHADFALGLRFLMSWPALAEGSTMIEARPDDIKLAAEEAELWAARLRRRFPSAAHLLLRRAAAAAFRRREFKTSDRLTVEAETIVL